MIAATARQLGRQSERSIDFRAFRIIKVGWHYSDYSSGHAVGRDRFIDYVGIGAKTALPQAVRQEDHCVLARFVLFRRKTSSQHGFYPNHVEEVCRHLKPLHALWRI